MLPLFRLLLPSKTAHCFLAFWTLKGTSRARFCILHNAWKPLDNRACTGYNTSLRGPTGAFWHCSGLPLASPGGPLKTYNLGCFKTPNGIPFRTTPSLVTWTVKYHWRSHNRLNGYGQLLRSGITSSLMIFLLRWNLRDPAMSFYRKCFWGLKIP